MSFLYNKTFYISLFIFLFVLVLLIRLNFKHSSLLPIAMMCVLAYFYYIWQKNQVTTNSQSKDVLLKNLLKYPKLYQIYNNSKKLIKYANFTNFENSVSNILKMLNIYNVIINNVRVINNISFSHHYYELLHQYGNKAKFYFKNIQANIPVRSRDMIIFTQQYDKLEKEIENYLAETTKYNDYFLNNYQSLSHFSLING